MEIKVGSYVLYDGRVCLVDDECEHSTILIDVDTDESFAILPWEVDEHVKPY